MLVGGVPLVAPLAPVGSGTIAWFSRGQELDGELARWDVPLDCWVVTKRFSQNTPTACALCVYLLL